MLKDTVNHLNVEIIQEPEHVHEKVNLKPKLGESETGTDQDMLFRQI